LKGYLSETEKTKLLLRLNSYIDDELTLFLRFDKREWTESKKLLLTESGDCFHIRISLAAFPKRRDAALNVARKIFG
jgi:RNA-binding protein